jgi:hypothetical protein
MKTSSVFSFYVLYNVHIWSYCKVCLFHEQYSDNENITVL